MKEPIFTGSAVAIITPMNDDCSVNYDEFKKFIDYQIDNGTDAIVICGTTGESSTLKTVHHLEAIKFCVDYVTAEYLLLQAQAQTTQNAVLKSQQRLVNTDVTRYCLLHLTTISARKKV